MVSAVGVVVVGLVALLAGAGLGYWFARQGQELEAGKAKAAEAALDDYKVKVNEHFQTTAEHFKLIGQQYKDMYEQVAASADELMTHGEIESHGNPFLRIGLLPDAATHAEEAVEADPGIAAEDDSETVAAIDSDAAAATEATELADDETVAADAGGDDTVPPTDTDTDSAAAEPQTRADGVTDDTAELPVVDADAAPASTQSAATDGADQTAVSGDTPETDASIAVDVDSPADELPHPAHNGATNGAAGAPEVTTTR